MDPMCMAHRTKALRIALALLAGVVATTGMADTSLAAPGDRARVNSLSVPMFGDRSEALWPLQIGLEIVSESGEVVVPRRELVVSDGQHTIFSEVVATPKGSHAFELELVARHHAGDAIELEYDLQVRQARFNGLTWTGYLLHRLSLAPRPALGQSALAAARADIVETREQPNQPAHRQTLTVDGDRYEIRLYAASLRG
ncbi:hypothetical protein DB30_04190 [Enhygromyxa salina]|uniref:Uncharacterized protein n=2 Tax=Enhygromyxa salina TaxID=215803 RepID=A0A0C2D9Z4_9BACT|nr:hypothetical protein DB30_04190 [Enhygromyxa salina]